ncbi:MAG: YkgJ family cysteine cluster protein [Desulfurococcaceae archaeon]
MFLKRGDRIRFTCIRCGRCCSTGPNVALTIFDICRIAKYLNMEWRDLRGKYVYLYVADVIPIPVIRGLGDKCVFLVFNDVLPECSIYPVRPMRCRLYPFLPVSPGDKNKLSYDKYCLGIGEGFEIEPPWEILEKYYDELKLQYSLIYDYVFNKGYEPVNAIEEILDKTCSENTRVNQFAQK